MSKLKKVFLSFAIIAISFIDNASLIRSNIGGRSSSIGYAKKEYIPASQYIQDGLNVMFDAIENVSELTHDSSSLVWLDLVGGLRMDMSSSAWTDSSFVCSESNNGHVNWKTMPEYPGFPLYMTIEVVVRNCQDNHFSRNSLVFGGREYQRMNLVRSTIPNVWGMSYLKDGFFFGNSGTVSAVFSDSSSTDRTIYVNGSSSETTGSFKENFGISGIQGISINARSDYPFNGEVCCIRLYRRKLTEEEIAYNAAIDKKRFSLP